MKSEKAPVYKRIKEDLKEKIERGELQEGERIPSEIALAKRLSVNRSQTRQALRELQLEGYLVRRQGSGTFVAPRSNGVSAVKVDGMRSMAIVIPKNIVGHSREIVQGFMHRSSEEDCQVITYNLNLSEADDVSEVRFLRSVVESGVSGVVAWVTNDSGATHDFVRELVQRRFPLVLVDRYLSDIHTDFVVTDNEALGYELTAALIKRGHKRIAFVGLEHPNPSSVRDRLTGYRKALKEASLPFDEDLMMDIDLLKETPERAVGRMVALYERPTAFVCTHMDPFFYMHGPLTQLGYRAAENIDIAVVDDNFPESPTEVPLIRIPQRGYEIGLQSAEILLKRIAEPDRAVEQCFVKPGALIDKDADESTRLVNA
jgi:GntR family transcriptional regulator of arabinose operon